MDHEAYKKAAEYWIQKDKDSLKMDRDKLWNAIMEYISSNNTCALATGTGTFVRCTPIEYVYHHDAFWMFSEGGEKFIALENNKNVCLAIFDKYQGFGNLKGMQVTGIAQMVEPFTEEYITAAEFKKIPIDALRKLSEPINVIKIIPEKIEYLNSDFKKSGYDSRQKYEL